MSAGVFVTGTDTEVGKTVVAAGLLRGMRERGLRVAGYKPVAAGCEWTDEGWRNEDALALADAAGTALPYQAVNPVALPAAMAPHLAAEDEGVELSLAPLVEGFHALRRHSDWVLVEGAGGWRVPLNAADMLAGLAVRLDLPVILVVAIRLGCISHALLTAEAIARDGLRLAGWVANRVDMADGNSQRQIASIAARIDAPLLGTVPDLPDHGPESVANCLDLSSLR